MNTATQRAARGQALVVMTLALVALLGGLGLIIDGGNAWAQQRITQTGSDAASQAGAVVLARRMTGASSPALGWDAEVNSAVNRNATTNGVAVTAAYYTDICGTLLRPDGTRAAGTGDAALVGGGALPTNSNTNPDCPSGTVGPVAGVQVAASRVFGTFVSRVIGFDSFTASTNATAVSGLLQGICAASEGCVVLPVTTPATVVTCAGNGEAEPTSTVWPRNTRVIVPLCKDNPGNVGWLDWSPPGGGTSELIQSILTPNNPTINLPSWQYVTSTGNVNSRGVEDALNTYAGQVVLFPQFDLTCGSNPNVSQVAVGPNYGCSDIRGRGQNQWYRIPQFAAFELEGAHISGNNRAACDTGNGATSCLIGKFVNFIATGTVGPGVGGGTTQGGLIGTQLIK